jgi:hypothetical protein
MLRSRIRLLSVAIATIGLLLFTNQTSPAYATSIEVLPQVDSYLIKGGVIHHSNFTKDRDEAATCSNCFWKIREICKSWQDSSHGSCPWLRLQCPNNMQLVEVYRANANSRPPYISNIWYFVSFSCIGQAGPISTIDISTTLSNIWVVDVPKLRIKFLPPNDAILWQPIKYQILSKQTIEKVTEVFENQVTIRAKSFLEFSCMQSIGSNSCLSQKFNSIKFKEIGSKLLLTKSTWSATFDALGIFGIPVDGPNPSFEIKTPFQVHPLFTHLLS